MKILRLLQVFFCGGAVMILEVVGTRLLAPIFGGSLVVWAAQISVTLAALSLGYVLGGALADRWPSGRALHPVVLASGVLSALAVFLSASVMKLALGLGLAPGAFLSSGLLFGPALILLGSVGPQAVRVGDPAKPAGKNLGEVLALSTLGSLASTLLAAFVLIPTFGIKSCFLATAAILAGLGSMGIWGVRRGAGLAVLIAAALAAGGAEAQRGSGSFRLIGEKHSFHGDLRIVEQGPVRMLLMDGIIQSGKDQRTGLSAFSYTHVLDGLAAMFAPAAKTAVVVGLGAGVLPEALAQRGLDVEVLELDHAVAVVARDHFGFPVGIPVRVGDGRVLLAEMAGERDIIILDVYSGDVSPFQLLTLEAFALAKSKLSGRGILLVNLLGTMEGESARVPRAVAATLRDVFSKVWLYGSKEAGLGRYSNLLYVAGDLPSLPPPAKPGSPLDPRLAAEVLEILSSGIEPSLEGSILTDDFNPVDLWDRGMRRRWRMDTLRYLGIR